jgi:hypothetical protein
LLLATSAKLSLALLILTLGLLLASRPVALTATPRLTFRPLLRVGTLLAPVALLAVPLIRSCFLVLLTLRRPLTVRVRSAPTSPISTSLRCLLASGFTVLPVVLLILILIVQKILLLRGRQDGNARRGTPTTNPVHTWSCPYALLVGPNAVSLPARFHSLCP